MGRLHLRMGTLPQGFPRCGGLIDAGSGTQATGPRQEVAVLIDHRQKTLAAVDKAFAPGSRPTEATPVGMERSHSPLGLRTGRGADRRKLLWGSMETCSTGEPVPHETKFNAGHGLNCPLQRP